MIAGRLTVAGALWLGLTAFSAGAEPLATYWEQSGTVPPEYAWRLSVDIADDGALSLRYCRGYETEGPACWSAESALRPEALAAIEAAAAASGLAGNPAAELADSEIPVGGGARGGTVILDGQTLRLPPFPQHHDAARVETVLDAIAAAIPADLRAEAEAQAKAP